MDFTDLLSELTKPLLPTKAMVISFLVFLSLCIVAIVAEKLNFTNVAGVCAGLSVAMAVVTVVITVSQPGRPKLDYDLSRDKTHVYVSSHNDRLESAKLKIIGEDKHTVYVLYKDETYKIPVIVDKR